MNMTIGTTAHGFEVDTRAIFDGYQRAAAALGMTARDWQLAVIRELQEEADGQRHRADWKTEGF